MRGGGYIRGELLGGGGGRGLSGSVEGGGGGGGGGVWRGGTPPLPEDDNISWAPGTPPDQDGAPRALRNRKKTLGAIGKTHMEKINAQNLIKPMENEDFRAPFSKKDLEMIKSIT